MSNAYDVERGWKPGEPIPAGMPMADSGNDATAALGVKDKTIGSQIARAKRQEVAADDSAIKRIEGAANDIPHLQEMARQVGVEAKETLKPWNEAEEAKKRQTDPVEAFASLGSVFGILASAFTHQPMQNALEASAAAINAIHAGDREDYDRAHKAWEDNTKMALDRYKIEHQAFEDAVTLMKTNMEVGVNQMRLNAVRFGNQKELVMIEHGMIKEVLDYRAAQQRLSLELQEALPKITLANAQMSRLFALGYDPKNPTSEKSQQAWLQFKKEEEEHERAKHAYSANPTKIALDRFVAENPDATAEQMADFVRNLKGPAQSKIELERDKLFSKEHTEQNKLAVQEKRNDEIARHNRAIEDIQASGGDVKKALADERIRHDKAMEGLGEKRIVQGATSHRELGVKEQAIKDKAKELIEKKGLSIAEANSQAQDWWDNKHVKITQNRADDIRKSIGRIESVEQVMDKIEALLKKHNAITGFGGHVTRAGETLAEIFGSNSSDFKEFERLVDTIQTMGPRVLLDSRGRPLGAETEKTGKIFAGNNLGDLNANTLRAYKELRDIFEFQKQDYKNRLAKGLHEDGVKEEKPSSERWWEDPAAGRVKQ